MRIRSWFRFWGWACSCAALVGCAGGSHATVPPVPTEAENAAAAPASPGSAAAAKPAAAETGDATGVAPDAPPHASSASSASAEDPNAIRDVIYVLVPGGLKITVAGVKFTVSSSAAQVGTGWGVKVSSTASAEDGNPHSLSSPKTGPMAFAGSVTRKGKSEPEAFGDERSGDGEQSIFGDDPSNFSRTWPAKGERPLALGDALDLQVALWGLGANAESRRPVKQFCRVRMEVGAKGKPRAIVEPPQSATGK